MCVNLLVRQVNYYFGMLFTNILHNKPIFDIKKKYATETDIEKKLSHMRLCYCILKMSQYGTTEKQVYTINNVSSNYAQNVDFFENFVFVGNLMLSQSFT